MRFACRTSTAEHAYTSSLVQNRAARIQAVIAAAGSDELIVRTALDNRTLFQHDDFIRISDGAEAVRDDEHRPALHKAVHTFLDKHFGSRVDRTRRFIEDEHRRIGDGSACDRNELPLSLAQISAVARNDGIVSLFKSADKSVRICKAGRSDNLRIACFQMP